MREKQPIVRLVDSSRIEMVVDVPETLISYARLVGDVEVIFDPFPDLVIPAKIKEIGSKPTETTRTYPVTLIMDQPEGVVILPGMAGKASPKGPPPPEVAEAGLIVPDTAVFTPGRCKDLCLGARSGGGGRPSPGIGPGTSRRFGLAVLDGVDAGRVGRHGRRALSGGGPEVRLPEEIEGEEEVRQ